MDRREFLLSTSVGGVTLTAGCSNNGPTEGSDTEIEDPTGDDETETPTEDEHRSTDTQPDDVVYHVDTAGSDAGDGSPDAPLATIQEALHRAEPGATITVHPGEYMESYAPGEPLHTVRAGKPGSPITITGPSDAILRPGIEITHSHIELTGLRVDALIDPENPEDPESYFDTPILITPPADSATYLTDIVCAPEGVGNAAYSLIRVIRTNGIEIGPLRVTGIAGARWILPDEPDRHAGEIVYLGSPPTMVYPWHGPAVEYPWEGEIDETQAVHIHHIDNSDGHPHSQLVDAKLGTRDVTIEYCTDGGGSQNTEPYPASAIALRSHRATVRWCRLHNGDGDGILINAGGRYVLQEAPDPTLSPNKIGTKQQIYGNEIVGFGTADVTFQTEHPDSQQHQFEPLGPTDLAAFCENDLETVFTRKIDNSSTREIETDPDRQCAEAIPKGNGIGHTGG